MKRLYKRVDVGEGHRILLDGRPVKTPAKAVLVIPGKPLAEAVAAEWAEQDETIRPDEMPITRLATSVIDLMPERRGDALAEAMDHARTDLLCYRAASPEDLRERQALRWQPWLDWAARELSARLIFTDSIQPIEQPEAAIQSLQRHVDALDDWRLMGLHATTKLTGSLVLALAATRSALDATTALDAALLDELYEIERWGAEEEQEKRHAALRRDLTAALRFLDLLG